MANPTIGGVGLLALQEVLEYCHNWFFDPERVYVDTYTIVDGGVEAFDRLKYGQYYRISGSDFNDGLHQFGDDNDDLIDEIFYGSIWALSIPKAVVELAKEIEDWQETYGAAATSPLASESFGGYTYTKASGVTADGGMGGWQAAFGPRLNRWRKYG